MFQVLLPAKLDGVDKKRLYASATRDESSGEIILKIVNGESAPAEIQLQLNGLGKSAVSARVTVLTGAKRTDENSFAEPKKIFPVESSLKLTGKGDTYKAPALSLTVLRVK